MANYEIDEIIVIDGDIIAIGPNDKILGLIDGPNPVIVILRWVAKR